MDNNRVGYVYDHAVTEHYNTRDSEHPENPGRVHHIIAKLCNTGLLNKMTYIDTRHATDDELRLVHSQEYINQLKSLETMFQDDINKYFDQYDSVYGNQSTYKCASLAVGSTLNLVDAVINAEVNSGIAIVRPPGHHAMRDHPMGFCILGTVAIASIYARNIGLKVAVLDFDIHHGNGTQEMLCNEHDILFHSIQRYDWGDYWPGTGTGTQDNVHNHMLNDVKGTNADYKKIMIENVIPSFSAFEPDIIIVSAGFDSAKGDPLGGYRVTPSGYADMIELLMNVQSNIVLVLEGGYSLTALADSAYECVKKMFDY